MVNTMDKETFNILAHRLRRDIYAQSLRFLKDEDEAEDVLGALL